MTLVILNIYYKLKMSKLIDTGSNKKVCNICKSIGFHYTSQHGKKCNKCKKVNCHDTINCLIDKCTRCFKEGHYEDECTEEECSECGKVGHNSSACYENKKCCNFCYKINAFRTKNKSTKSAIKKETMYNHIDDDCPNICHYCKGVKLAFLNHTTEECQVKPSSFKIKKTINVSQIKSKNESGSVTNQVSKPDTKPVVNTTTNETKFDKSDKSDKSDKKSNVISKNAIDKPTFADVIKKVSEEKTSEIINLNIPISDIIDKNESKLSESDYDSDDETDSVSDNESEQDNKSDFDQANIEVYNSVEDKTNIDSKENGIGIFSKISLEELNKPSKLNLDSIGTIGSGIKQNTSSIGKINSGESILHLDIDSKIREIVNNTLQSIGNIEKLSIFKNNLESNNDSSKQTIQNNQQSQIKQSNMSTMTPMTQINHMHNMHPMHTAHMPPVHSMHSMHPMTPMVPTHHMAPIPPMVPMVPMVPMQSMHSMHSMHPVPQMHPMYPVHQMHHIPPTPVGNQYMSHGHPVYPNQMPMYPNQTQIPPNPTTPYNYGYPMYGSGQNYDYGYSQKSKEKSQTNEKLYSPPV